MNNNKCWVKWFYSRICKHMLDRHKQVCLEVNTCWISNKGNVCYMMQEVFTCIQMNGKSNEVLTIDVQLHSLLNIQVSSNWKDQVSSKQNDWLWSTRFYPMVDLLRWIVDLHSTVDKYILVIVLLIDFEKAFDQFIIAYSLWNMSYIFFLL